MIPILYDYGETVFISNGLGRLRDAISVVVSEERNGIYECNFEYPVDGVLYDKIQLGRIIAVEHDDTSDVQPFDIVSCERPINGTVVFHAQHISYRLNGIVASGKSINSLSDALAMLAQGVPSHPFTFEADFVSDAFMAAADGIPRSVRQMLGGIEGSILDTYGGELEFDRWNVILHRSRGEHRSFAIRYGVNLTDYNESLDYSETFNMCVPYWYSEEEGLVKGDLVESGENTYNAQSVCIALDLTDKFEEKPTKAQLEAAAQSMLSGATLPKQSIEVNFIRLQDTTEYSKYANLQQCKLCDTIPVIFPKYGVEANLKIVSTEYDVLNERFISMQLGDLSTTLSEALGLTDSLEPTKANEDVDVPADYITLNQGWSCEAITAAKSGRLAQVRMDLKYESDISVPASGNITDLAVGTVNDAWKPVMTTVVSSWGNNAGNCHGYISNSGALSICAFEGTGTARTITAGTTINLCATYIC